MSLGEPGVTAAGRGADNAREVLSVEATPPSGGGWHVSCFDVCRGRSVSSFDQGGAWSQEIRPRGRGGQGGRLSLAAGVLPEAPPRRCDGGRGRGAAGVLLG